MRFVQIIDKANTLEASINLDKVPIVDFSGPSLGMVCFRELNGNVIGYGFADEVSRAMGPSEICGWAEAMRS